MPKKNLPSPNGDRSRTVCVWIQNGPECNMRPSPLHIWRETTPKIYLTTTGLQPRDGVEDAAGATFSSFPPQDLL
ncbi:hypothetical protein JTE90_006495 [Oedothorax gibbosus]|uniref:Uncharacterized protein n=1 Tax=Oedothorax gibbosus TaxID=931172 RepID=A0AAV6VNX6_9ARAC|nr:hypothetical protein JTE90_006495 [Oedothorax gibbosus]